MTDLASLLRENEAWLMQRALRYASERGPAPHLAALESVWHVSFEGMGRALEAALAEGSLELGTEDPASPIAEFGQREAKQHRLRGIRPTLVLGLLKHYRPAYLDLVQERVTDPLERSQHQRSLDRFFDLLEIALVEAWVASAEADENRDLQERNFELLLERDRFVTIFESLPDPIVLLDVDRSVRVMNHAAMSLFLGPTRPGAQYYLREDPPPLSVFSHLLPAFQEDMQSFLSGENERAEHEWVAQDGRTFRGTFSRMLDLPATYAGTLVVLEDLTARKEAEQERERLIKELQEALADVKQLSGLLPICSWCRKIRDDKGYWSQLESFLTSHSHLVFTHGVCPECKARLLAPKEPS